MNQPQSLHGVKVVISHDYPKMKLAEGEYITPKFRQEIDAWLIEFFGMTNLIPDGKMIHIPSTGTVHVNPRTYAQLKTAAPKGVV